MNPNLPEGYHPPHVTHAHPPHIGEPPPLDVQYVHPDVLEFQSNEEARKQALASQYLGWGIVLFLGTMLPSAYCSYRIFKNFGWWMIFPPMLAVPIIGSSLVILVEVIVVGLICAGAKILFPTTGGRMKEWFDVEDFSKLGAMSGIPVGFLLYLVSELIH